MKKLIALVFLLGALFAIATPSEAAVCTATTASQFTACLNAAAFGDTIKLQAGSNFEGEFTLKNIGVRGVQDYVTITTTADTANLPPVGYRIGPAYEAYLPKVFDTQSSAFSNGPTLKAQAGANGYLIRYVEFNQTFNGLGTVVSIGDNDDSWTLKSQQPYDIHFYQDYWNLEKLNPYWLQKRAIGLHGKNLTVADSYLIGCDSPTTTIDSSCIWVMNGEGPYNIVNNAIKGATESFITGGDDTKIKTIATVSGGGSTTGANLTWTAGDAPIVGQTLAILYGANTQRCDATVTSYTAATATSGTVVWSPACPTAPDAPGDIRWGVSPGGLNFRYNHVFRNPDHMNDAIVPTPGSFAPTAGTGGSLAAGDYQVQIQARASSQLSTIQSAASTIQTVTVGASGSIHVSWTAVPTLVDYRVYVKNVTAGTWSYTTFSASATSGDITTTGTAASAPPSGTKRRVKALFELKMCDDCVIRYNIFEYNWVGVDIGYALWFKVVNQPNARRMEYATTRDVDFSYNIIRHVDGAFLISGREYDRQIGGTTADMPTMMERFSFTHNLVYDSGSAWKQNGSGIASMKISNGCWDCTIDHNTMDHDMVASFLLESDTTYGYCPGLTVTNNFFRFNSYGIKGNSNVSLASGSAALDAHCQSDWAVNHNVLAGGSSSGMPAGNFFPTLSAYQGQFTDFSNQNFLVQPTSAYHNAASDSTDIGADIAAVLENTSTAISGDLFDGGGPPPPALPVGWTFDDIGTPGATGVASGGSGAFSVSGAGADVWGTADALGFVHTTLVGNGYIVARVTGVENVNQWTKAGVMMRSSTAAGSVQAFMLVTPSSVKGTSFQRRIATNGISTATAGPASGPPYWVRLTRNGNVITAEVSLDGNTWSTVGSDTFALGASVEVGLAVGSHVDGTLATATFDNVLVAVEVLAPRFKLRFRIAG